MKKLILTLILGILLIGTASAFLNTKEDIQFGKGISKYGKIEIRDWYGLSKRVELELKENTELCLPTGCYAKQEITMYQDGVLIDDIRFITIEGSNKVDYEIRYKINDKWIKYELGDEIKGNSNGIIYEVELIGNLQGFSTVDWQIKSQGFWIEDWAIWSSALNTGLVAYWNHDETSGLVLEDAIDGIHNGTVSNESLWVTGLLGNSINYSSHNYTLVADSPDWDVENFSLQAWINPDTSGAINVISRGSTGMFWYLNLRANNSMFFDINTTESNWISIGSDSVLDNESWTHIVVVYNGVNLTMYFNGTIQSNVEALTGSIDAIHPIHFAQSGASSAWFDGQLDEVGFWNRTLTDTEITQLYNRGEGITQEGGFIGLDSPLYNSEYLRSEIIEFNSTLYPTKGNLSGTKNLVNATIFIWDSDSVVVNETTNIVTGDTENQSTFNIGLATIGTLSWNVLGCIDNVSDTWCDYAISNSTIIINAFTENSQTFNSSAYETANEEFILNITTDGLQTVSADLVYNGTSYTGTKSGTDEENIFTKTITIPTISAPGNKSFYWEITTGSDVSNSSFQNQYVNFTNLDLCNSTLTNIYINFSFKNETVSEEVTNATISSSWTYYIAGDGSINKTLSFSNTTENPDYTFCFSPEDKNLNTIIDLNYNNEESQQRALTQTSLLTNLTTNQILYLLPTSLGLFSQFQTVTINGEPISLVKGLISRTLGGSTINIVSGLTDSSGLSVFFLNPDVTYNALFTKLGFTDNSFTFTPITDTRIVTMGGGATEIGNGTNVAMNTSYTIEPSNSTLQNETDYTFRFIVSSSQPINYISMNITNSSGGQLLFDSDTSTGTLSGVVHTGNLTQIIGYYEIKTFSETLSFSRMWVVGSFFEGDYSLNKQLTFFSDYEFKDFWKYLIVLITIIGVLIFMSAGEITDTSESKIIVAVLLIWVFSLVGWLNTGLTSSATNATLSSISQFSNQFGIAILSTAAGVFFVLRRVFT